MNILQISNKAIFPPDGGTIATLNLAKAYAYLGHNIHLLNMLTHKHSNNQKLIPKELRHKITLDGVKVNTNTSNLKALKNLLFSKLPYNAERFISENFRKHLINLLKTKDFDIIQIEGLYPLLYLSDIKNNSNALVAYRSHNIEHEIWKGIAKEKNNIFIKTYLKILSKRILNLEKKYLNKYDVILPISSNDAISYKKLNCNIPIHTTTAGVNISEFDKIKVQTTNSNSLFYIGALDWQPNQNGLLWFIKNVWAQIIIDNKDIKFYIAGRNAPKWFENKISMKNIIYLGEIKNAY
ncbi:MAG: glycosyltransferase, partial [Bacteroidota bacterium]|nr:glycosyltransferase [Bacteroidota bacterium]